MEHDKPKKNDVHPTMKPVEILCYLIGNSLKRGGMSSARSVRQTQTFNEKDYAAADLHSRKEPVFDF